MPIGDGKYRASPDVDLIELDDSAPAANAGAAPSVLDRMRLDGRVALVTGGSQGLGLAMANALADAGASVAIVARRRDRLDRACDELRRPGREALAIEADLVHVEQAVDAVDRAADHFGRLDIIVTAAGTQLRKDALEVTPAEWDEVVAVNLRSVYFACQRAARRMLASALLDDRPNRGKIINVASLTAVGAWPGVSVYGMAKGGIVQMTKAFALEWGKLGITVNAIGPGTFPTELTTPLYDDPDRLQSMLTRLPLGRAGAPQDVGGAVVLLASSASDYITGQVIWVDGGWLVT